jgi:hypothetical protein
MDAADPRIDYLSGTDGPRGYELYGLLSLNLKKRPSPIKVRGSLYRYDEVKINPLPSFPPHAA